MGEVGVVLAAVGPWSIDVREESFVIKHEVLYELDEGEEPEYYIKDLHDLRVALTDACAYVDNR